LYGRFISRPYIFFGAFSFLPELKENRKVLNGRIDLFVKVYPVFVQLCFFQDGSGPLIIVPKAGRK
jgi:hypothetical protein